MKKLAFLLVLAFVIISCGDNKKQEDTSKSAEPVAAPSQEQKTAPIADQAAIIELGKKLFTEKTCVSCHAVETKLVGPSIKDINKIYNEKGGDIVKFLKEEEGPIVETDPGMVAIMKANLDGFVKTISDDDKHAIAAYMKSVQ